MTNGEINILRVSEETRARIARKFLLSDNEIDQIFKFDIMQPKQLSQLCGCAPVTITNKIKNGDLNGRLMFPGYDKKRKTVDWDSASLYPVVDKNLIDFLCEG